MSFEENFLYPLGLLIVGGIISGLLIPFFNFLHKQKLIEIENVHEKAQKRIDREREDYKFELQIKSKILEKLTELSNRIYQDFSILIEKENSDYNKTHSIFLSYLVHHSDRIKDYLVLYFNSNEELMNEWQEIYSMCNLGVTMCASQEKSTFRQESIDEFLTKFNMKLDKKEMKKSLEANRAFPIPIYGIAEKIRNYKKEIKDTKLD
ncbi:MAG: hypothetical protein IIB02_09495 [Thaumarchaeota archaeon]|nr:hypothetical protein [Nitrososphaerota archaeon]